MTGVCLITGGGRGIGRATALLAAKAGFDVAITFRERADAAGEVTRAVEERGRRAFAVKADMASEADIVAAFRAVDRELGPPVALVCNAGINAAAAVAALDAAATSHMFSVNVLAPMIACREAVRRMAKSRGGQGGAIVNVSSMAATIGGRPGSTAYAASKAAVDVFTTGLAREVAAEGIRVNVVRPGVTETEMIGAMGEPGPFRDFIASSIPMGRYGTPEEIAAAIVWLLTPAAAFVSGAHLNAGGGGFHIGPPRRP